MVSAEFLISRDLENVAFQVRLEHLFLGPLAEFLQPYLFKQPSINPIDANDTSAQRADRATDNRRADDPTILGIRAVAKLFMNGNLFCDPLVSDLGHLEILPNEKVFLPHINSNSGGFPGFPHSKLPCYVLNFSSVLTFPLSVADLPLNSRIELTFYCTDIDAEIGNISLQLFSSSGVLRNSRFLLPFNSSPSTSAYPSLPRAKYAFRLRNKRAAAASRAVSSFECISQAKKNSDDVDGCRLSSSSTDSLSSDDYSDPSPAQSILSSFLGDAGARQKRRNDDKRKGSGASSIGLSSATRQSFSTLPHFSNMGNSGATSLPSLKRPAACIDQVSQSGPGSYQSCIHQSSESTSEYSDGILISSASITGWSSSENWSPEVDSSAFSDVSSCDTSDDDSTQNEREKQWVAECETASLLQEPGGPVTSQSVDEHFRRYGNINSTCSEKSQANIPSIKKSFPNDPTHALEKELNKINFRTEDDMYTYVPSHRNNLAPKRVSLPHFGASKIAKKDLTNAITHEDADNSTAGSHVYQKSIKSTEKKSQMAKPSESICNFVYKAMNCYKILDLLARDAVPNCPSSRNVCQIQIQLECEKNLAKSLDFFGFIAICLPSFDKPVIYGTSSMPIRDVKTSQPTEEMSRKTFSSDPNTLLFSLDPSAFSHAKRCVSDPNNNNNEDDTSSSSSSNFSSDFEAESSKKSNTPLDYKEVDYSFKVDRDNADSFAVRFDDRHDDSATSLTQYERVINECVDWYLSAFDGPSRKLRRCVMDAAKSVVVHSALNESLGRQNLERSLPVKNGDKGIKYGHNSRSISFPSLDNPIYSGSRFTTSPWGASSALAHSRWNLTSSSIGASAQSQIPNYAAKQRSRQTLNLLQRCWTSQLTPTHIIERNYPLEMLYARQQRRLVTASMESQRLSDDDSLAKDRIEFASEDFHAATRMSEMDAVNLVLRISGDAETLTPSDKRLVWKCREMLKAKGISILKLSAVVNWNTPSQVAEFEKLLETWPLPSIEGLLELLSYTSKIPSVRHFACAALDAVPDDDIIKYLPQLVQAIRYDVPGPNAPVLTCLLRRAAQCPYLASSLHWCLQCETEDSEKGHLYIRGHQRLLEALAKGSDGSLARRALRVLELQRRLVMAMRHLSNKIRDKKDRADRKTERLRELIQASRNDEGLLLSLMNCQPPVPMPISPHGWLLGIVPEKSHVVRSSQYPLVLACRVLIPTMMNSEETTCKRIWEDLDDVSIECLKEKGYVEVLKKYMFKSGDDLRQDLLVTQIIKLTNALLNRYGCDYKFTLYDVVAFSRSDGLIEFIEKSDAISSIKKSHPTLRHYFTAYSPDSTSPLGFPQSVLESFIRSCSGYSVITFLLGVGDRHLDNLLLCEDGRLFHVDFGFILGEDPKPFPPPIKLCSEMIEGLGGIGSEGYATFQLLSCQSYRCIRRHSKLILDILVLMIHSGLKGFRSDPLAVIAKVEEKFQLDVSEIEAEAFLLDIIGISATALFPAVVDKFHEWALYWK